jgi:hypothetical protein
MNNSKTVVIIILFVILVAWLGYTRKIQDIHEETIKKYQDTLRYYIYMNTVIELENDSLMTSNDSLIALPPKIKTIYREKYIFIEHSDINELDSIVRADLR